MGHIPGRNVEIKEFFIMEPDPKTTDSTGGELNRRSFVVGTALAALGAASVGGLSSNARAAESAEFIPRSPNGTPLPETSVHFETRDPLLQNVITEAERLERRNIMAFTPKLKVLVEGARFFNVWLETQPMGGAMYAKRNLEVGLNNQLIFMDTQRADGRLPGMVTSDHQQSLRPDYRMLQGYYFPTPAWKIYFLIQRDRTYLSRLYDVLEKYDRYLWRTRNSNGHDCLESWCVWDTGESHSTRYKSKRYGNAPDWWAGDTPPQHSYTPFESMEIMGFSHDGRLTLSRISRELNNGMEKHWADRAMQVRKRLAEYLWRPEKHACYDRDKTGRFMDVLIHNNLRAMWYHAFTQKMADEFIRYHLLNPREFWTPAALPSIAANDRKFRNDPRSDWSGQPEGLTYQRAIRALENYGHYAEVSLIGSKLLQLVGRTGVFVQQYDPFTGKPCGCTFTPHYVPVNCSGPNGYGPTILSVLEYTSHMYGVDLDEDRVLWSGLARGGFSMHYAQRWGTNVFALENRGNRFAGRINGRTVFTCSTGVRVVTDLDGVPQKIIGIDQIEHNVTLHVGKAAYAIKIKPNQEFHFSGSGKLQPAHSAPFDYPFKANI
jgi:hypothetical protein